MRMLPMMVVGKVLPLFLLLSAAAADDMQHVTIDESGSASDVSLESPSDVSLEPIEEPMLDPGIHTFARDYNKKVMEEQRKQWDLPDEPSVYDLNSCALCEAAAFDGAASMLRWYDDENKRLAAAERQRANKKTTSAKAKAPPRPRMDVSRLMDDFIEASCTDHDKWRTRYRQIAVNAGGTAYMVIMGPGIEPLPGKEKKPANVFSGGGGSQFEQEEGGPSFGEFEQMVGRVQPDEREHEEEMTQEIVNTLVRDCGTVLGELEEDELEELAIEASKANASAASRRARAGGGSSSRHEDDFPAAAVVRKALCTRRGAQARCKMAAEDRKEGFTPVSTKAKAGTKRRTTSKSKSSSSSSKAKRK